MPSDILKCRSQVLYRIDDATSSNHIEGFQYEALLLNFLLQVQYFEYHPIFVPREFIPDPAETSV